MGEMLQDARILEFTRVNGNSMAPALQDKDLVKILKTSRVSPGDIILFEKSGERFLHRLVEIKHCAGGDSYLTKGDNFSFFDLPVSPEQVIGKVAAVERSGVLLDLSSPKEKLRSFLLARYAFYAGESYHQYLAPAKAEIELFKAKKLLEEGRNTEARKMLLSALPLSPCKPELWFTLGLSAFRCGEEEKAAQCFQRASELNPELWLCYTNLAEIARRKKDFPGALKQLRKLLQLNRQGLARGYAYNLWGNILVDRGKIKPAMARYRSALAMLPDYPAAHLNYAWALEESGALTSADLHYRRALGLGSRDPKLYRAYSAFLLKTGRRVEARRLLQETLQKGIYFPEFISHWVSAL